MAQYVFQAPGANPRQLEMELQILGRDAYGLPWKELSVYATTDVFGVADGAIVILGRTLTVLEEENITQVINDHVPADDFVNGIEQRDSLTTVAPSFEAVGSDTNIDINMVPKGTGRLKEASVNVLNENSLIPADHILMPSNANPSTYDLSEDFTARGSSGVLDGTLTYVSVGSTAVKISVAAGEGYIRTSNDQQAPLVKCSWAAAADLYTFSAPAAGQENVIFIGIEYSGGVASAVTKAAFSQWNWYSNFPLARCSYDGTTMWILNAYAHSEDTANLARKFNRLIHPFSRESSPEGTGGLELTSSGRALALSGGNIWHGFNRYAIEAIVGPATFATYYRRAGGGFNKTAGVTEWPNTQYDDGSGTLATMTNNRYGTLWVYLNIADGTLDVIYGAVNATSIQLAQADLQPSVPAHLSYHGRLVARIIYQKSASSASLIESAWAPGYMPSPGNYQPSDDTLTAMAGLTITEGCLIYGTGTDALAVLAKGNPNTMLVMNGGGTAPSWTAQPDIPVPFTTVNPSSGEDVVAGPELGEDVLNLNGTSPISVSGTAATRTIAIGHATTSGNKHLPISGAIGQLLVNSGVAGTGAWGTVTESSGALANVTTLGMSGQLTSTQGTGSAPFVIASTTVCSNLNADMLDSMHAVELHPRMLSYVSVNTTVPQYVCYYVTRKLEIAAGITFEIASLADTEIG